MHLIDSIDLSEELVYKVLVHFKKYRADYAKSVGRNLKLNKREACKILKALYAMGLLSKRRSGMLKRGEAKLKRRVVTQPHHTYYVLSKKGKEYLKQLELKMKRC